MNTKQSKQTTQPVIDKDWGLELTNNLSAMLRNADALDVINANLANLIGAVRASGDNMRHLFNPKDGQRAICREAMLAGFIAVRGEAPKKAWLAQLTNGLVGAIHGFCPANWNAIARFGSDASNGRVDIRTGERIESTKNDAPKGTIKVANGKKSVEANIAKDASPEAKIDALETIAAKIKVGKGAFIALKPGLDPERVKALIEASLEGYFGKGKTVDLTIEIS